MRRASAPLILLLVASGCGPVGGGIEPSPATTPPPAALVTLTPSPTTPPPPTAPPTPSPIFAVRLDPPQPLPGRDFLVVVEGLTPRERVEIDLAWSDGSRTFALTAEPNGRVLVSVPAGASTRFVITARRASGAVARAESAELAAPAPTVAVLPPPITPPPATVAPSTGPTAAPRTSPFSSSPVPVTTATAAPTPVPTATPTPIPTCAASGGDPGRTGVSGIVGYGGPGVDIPAGGVVVEAREGSATGRVLGSATSRSDGRFEILRLPAGAVVFLEVPDQPLYVDALSYLDGTHVCADQVVPFGYALIVMRYVTGLNYANGARIPSGATLRWDPVPEVTSYCVELRATTARPPGTCPGQNAGYPLGSATSFTLPSIPSGERIEFTLRAYSNKVFLPIALLRGGTYACCDGTHVFTIQ